MPVGGSDAPDQSGGRNYRLYGGVRDVTTPATDAGLEWQGWGTALKPAFEPIVVARKPLVGTVAANVLAHGTGASGGTRDPVDSPPPNGGLNGRMHREGLGRSSRSTRPPSSIGVRVQPLPHLPKRRRRRRFPILLRAKAGAARRRSIMHCSCGWLPRPAAPSSRSSAPACVIEGFRCTRSNATSSTCALVQRRLAKPIQPDMFGGVA
jgi:hypothetical protein